jgi:acetyl esterase/lipase
MAAMLATAAEVEGLDTAGCLAPRRVSPEVQAASAWFAPLDLRRRIGRVSSRPHVVNLLGADPERATARAALASPIVHASAGDAPMLLVHGTEDVTVDLDQSRAMRDALTAAGVPVVFARLEGAGHGFGLLSEQPADRPGACTTVEFLRRTLMGRSATD